MPRHRISPAEWQVLDVLWDKSPATAADVYAALGDDVHWHVKTVNTFLARLVDKGILTVQRDGRANVYAARISREECVRHESESFLQRVFGGAAGPMLAHFCGERRPLRRGDRPAPRHPPATFPQERRPRAMISLYPALFRVADTSLRLSAAILLLMLLRPWLRRLMGNRAMPWLWLIVAARLLLPWPVHARWTIPNSPWLESSERPPDPRARDSAIRVTVTTSDAKILRAAAPSIQPAATPASRLCHRRSGNLGDSLAGRSRGVARPLYKRLAADPTLGKTDFAG